jgi:hypothetical protein
MSEAIRLYGTDVPPVSSEEVTVGPLSFTLEDGALRHIRVGGIEIIRGIAFLVRDRDWGTLTPRLSVVSRHSDDTSFSLQLKAGFETANAALDVSIFIDAAHDRLSMRAEGLATGAFETNRAGFTVLHPAGLADYPVSITHSDGTVEAATFPILIDPWQPFMDITAMTHRADGFAVGCVFAGDIFETEDQRQWGDASYKTYVRPLALPWPYVLTQDEPLSQSVSIDWRRADTTRAEPHDTFVPGEMLFPETAILLTPQDAVLLINNPEDVEQVSPQRLLCHLDTTTDAIAEHCRTYARLQAAMPALVFDLELVCGFDNPPAVELAQVRLAMDASGFKPDSVMVCPAVDRQSTPPGSDWPRCPPLKEIHRASSIVFRDLVRGGGMVTFFPELNRKRPPMEALDFVSHSLCPIVHAADDLSIMETLETVRYIAHTARTIIGEADYRIGPSTIAMRQNPYGKRTIPNPDGGRVCMTDDDPRHGAAFGGAFVIGMACALAAAGVTVWTPSELYGPRGLTGPLRAAISLLAGCAGERVHKAALTKESAELIIGKQRIVANLTGVSQDGLRPYEFKTF